MTDGDDVQALLEQAVADRDEHARLSRQLHAVDSELENHVRQVEERGAALADESEDVGRLEEFSPTKIWSVLKGSHASDLERETAERDAARYALAEAEARRDALVRERDSLLAQRAGLGGVAEKYQEALGAKEAWIAEHSGPQAARLAQVAERRGELRALDDEGREAHRAGAAAASLLAQARDLLESAQSWSTWDTFGGGGLVTDMVKHDKMDRAAALLRQADASLRAFSRELVDVNLHAVEGLQLDGWSHTFDVWFDNIFSDMAVRSRIQDTLGRVAHTQQQVHHALTALEQKGHRLAAELAELEREREALVHGP